MTLIFSSLLTILSALVAIAFFTLGERKLMASVQRRRGPNVVGFWGLGQAFSDGLKLLLKGVIIPIRANAVLFLLAPSISLIVGLFVWVYIPFQKNDFTFTSDISLLWVYSTSSVGVYGIIGAGWASNSKYAFLGGLRSAAQLISYEVSMSLLLLPVVALANSFDLIEIVEKQAVIWNIVPLLPIAFVFFISLLAETNRAPFDLPEAEAEIVAGYNIEYSSMTFAMFFLAEYSNMLWLSVIASLLFFGGWLSPLSWLFPASSTLWLILKTVLVAVIIILVRATYPRYRYDQLMHIGWSVFLPFSLGFILLLSGILSL